MQIEEINGRKLNRRVSETVMIENVITSNLAYCVRRFVNEFLVGVATIEVGEVEEGVAYLCSFTMSEALREAVKNFAVSSPVHLTVSAVDGRLKIGLKYECERDPEVIECVRKFTLMAGMELSEEEGELALSVTYRPMTEVFLYASPPVTILHDLYAVFFYPF